MPLIKLDKKIIFSILFVAFLFLCCSFICVNAEENEGVSLINEEEYTQGEIIKEYLSLIQDELNNIDKEILNIKNQKEYTKYPAVRLNIQTPFLGIGAIVENKLNVKKDSALFDFSNKYSIRDVVNRKKIKVPSFKIGSIVILTSDLDLTGKLSLSEANNAVYSLNSYLLQTKEVENFIESQKPNLFGDYIPKEITSKKQELSNRIGNIEKELEKDGTTLSKIYILDGTSEDYKDLYKKYVKLNSNISEAKKSLDDVLITIKALTEVENKILSYEEEEKILGEQIQNLYEIEYLNIDISNVVNTMLDRVLTVKNDVNTFIETFEIKEQIKNKEESAQEDTEEKNSDKDIDTSYEIVSNVEIKNKEILDKINTLELMLEDKKQNLSAETENVDNVEKKVYTSKEDSEFVEKLYNNYNELIQALDNFYSMNDSNLLSDISNKINSLIGLDDVDVTKYIKDIYFDIPENLKKLSDNKDNFILKIDNIEALKAQKNKLVEIYLQINSVYSKKLAIGEIKS